MDGHSEADIVILTALDMEHSAVRGYLSSPRRLDHPAGTVFEIGQAPGGHGLIAIGITGVGNTTAAVLAERAIATFRPRALMFVGIAGALREDVALGDVVVATKVYAYQGGEERQDGFWARPRSWEISHQLDQAARRVHAAGTWTRLLAPDPARRAPAVHFSPVAAGEVVLKSQDGPLAGRLRHVYGDAVAIEMESAGAALAAHLNDRLPVISIRGISDRADAAKRTTDRQGWQQIAAANAAAFAVAVAADLCAAAPEAPLAASPWSRSGPAATVIPRQLPAPGNLLVGRAEQLSELDEILLPPARQQAPIAVLTGMAGVGKTALAVRWAHLAAGAFPDGQLYADAHGFGPGPPLRPREILAGFLRALGQSEAAERGTLEERAARFRTAVSQRRMIIVLDNVASAEQARPMLSGTSTCAMLITSRERLRGLAVHHGARLVEVGRLPLREAVTLLRTAVGERAMAEPGGAALLAARCAGLPLALRIAAEMVNSRPARDLGALAGELGDGGTALDLLDTGDDPYSAIRTVFSWSYRTLARPAGAAFRLLSLHPGDTFALPAAAALLGEPRKQAGTTLGALVNAHLLTETSAGRFEMHDLLRSYAQDLCAQTDDHASRLAAILRMADHYLHVADRASRMIMPYRYSVVPDRSTAVDPALDGRPSAMRWFHLERHNLVEICRLDDAELDDPRWRLAYVLRDYFYLTKRLDDWLETHELAVAGCERLGDRRAEGMTRNNLGRALLEAGRTDAAATQYRRAYGLFQGEGDEHGMTDALLNLASILRRQGRCEEALRDQLTALAFYRDAGLDRKAGITLRGIARTELALGRLADATKHAEQSLVRFRNLGLDLDIAESLSTLAQIYGERGDADRAEAAGQRALDHARRAGSDYEQARALHRLGAIAARAGRIETARQRWRAALTIFLRLGATAAETVRSDLRGLSGSGLS
jgi:nucleoside phosphorylase/tetratricopeptide (TPR) repeat protein